MRTRFGLLSIASIALGALFVSATAQAYIPPASFLLKLLAERRQKQNIRDISAHLQTEDLKKDVTLDERLYIKVPERLRLTDEQEAGVVYVEREGIRATGAGTQLERMKGPPTDLLATLLAPRGDSIESKGNRMIGALKKAGVDTEVVSLARHHGKAAYVIGAKAWEPEKPQVWLDKNTFLPVRFVLKNGATQHSLHLSEYGSSTTGNWLPRIMERYVDGKLVRRAEVVKVEVNQDLPETLFDIPKG